MKRLLVSHRRDIFLVGGGCGVALCLRMFWTWDSYVRVSGLDCLYSPEISC